MKPQSRTNTLKVPLFGSILIYRGVVKVEYESWRATYQSSEQAARSAFESAERLQKELDDIRNINDNLTRKNRHFIAEIEALENRVRKLKIKKFWRSEGGNEYWIYQGDETDNLSTLTCPVIIRSEDLMAIMKKRDELKAHCERLTSVLIDVESESTSGYLELPSWLYSDVANAMNAKPSQSLADIEISAIERFKNELLKSSNPIFIPRIEGVFDLVEHKTKEKEKE